MGMLQQVHGKKLGVSKLLALSALATVAIAGIGQTTRAALVASDNAGNSTYSSGWSTASNGGSGFGSWSLTPTGSNAGFFISSSTDNDNGNSLPTGDTADINTPDNSSGSAWGMYANSSSLATATRNFTEGDLGVGQSFSLAFDNGNIDTYSSDTLNLLNSSGIILFQFGFDGGLSDDYFYTDATSTAADTGIGFTYFGLDTVFTLTSLSTYSFTITPIDTNIPKTITGTINGSIVGFQAVDDNAGSGSGNNFYINSAAISAAPSSAVPIPATFGLVLMGGLGLAAIGLNRRRLKV